MYSYAHYNIQANMVKEKQLNATTDQKLGRSFNKLPYYFYVEPTNGTTMLCVL